MLNHLSKKGGSKLLQSKRAFMTRCLRLSTDAFPLAMSKALSCLTWVSIVLVELAGTGFALETILPQGDARASIVSPSFPGSRTRVRLAKLECRRAGETGEDPGCNGAGNHGSG